MTREYSDNVPVLILVVVLMGVLLAVVVGGMWMNGSMMGGGMMGGGNGGGINIGWLAAVLVLAVILAVIVAFLLASRPKVTPTGGPSAAETSMTLAPVVTAANSHSESASPRASSDQEAAIVKLLNDDEKRLYTLIREKGGEMLQRDIVADGSFSKAKVTRLLDKLERKEIVIRERHGMTNRIRLRITPKSSSEHI